MPDPQDEATFLRAKLNHGLRKEGRHRLLLELYRELIRLRRGTPALAHLSKDELEIKGFDEHELLFLRRWHGDNQAVVAFNVNEEQTALTLPVPAGRWRKKIDSTDERWQGEGSIIPEALDSEGELSLTFGPCSFALFTKDN